MLGAVLAVIIAVGLAGATIMLAPQTGTISSTQSQQSSQNISSSVQLSSSTAILGAQSVLIVQLTDPPIVPVGTTSLNLTYTAIELLVAEPTSTSTSTTSSSSTSSSTTSSSTSTSSTVSCIVSTTSSTTSKSTSQSSLVTSQTVTINPAGGSATVNLLKLQNISQTLASANLPNGSMIYSVTFVVSSINIEIGGVSSPVILATGGTSLLVALTTPAVVQGTVAILLDLNPTIIDTPTGYQMIPSSIGVIKPTSEISSQDHQVGFTQQLTDQDQNVINQVKGQLTAKLVGLSVSGSTSTITVQVSNSGCASSRLVLIGISGNFTDQSCVTTTSTTTSTQSNHEHSGNPSPHNCEGQNQLVFAPSVTSTTTSSSTTTTTTYQSGSCTTGQIALVNSAARGNGHNDLVIAPGQCVTLTFSGTISDGHSGNVLVPSTSPGQTYTVHLIASNIAGSVLNCVQPFLQTSCATTSSQGSQDGQGNQG